MDIPRMEMDEEGYDAYFTSVQEWIELNKDSDSIKIRKVCKFLDFRLSEPLYQYQNAHKIKDINITCEYRGKTYRLVGASRLGDVWISSRPLGTQYTDRVNITQLSNWKVL